MHNARSLIRIIATTGLCIFAFTTFTYATESYPQTEFTASISSSTPDWRVHKAYNADEAQILTAITEGLFVYDPYNLDPLPALAESWTVSANGLEWRFRIRKNARFETGEPITAAAVKASWLNLLEPATNAPYASLLDCIAGAAAFRTGVNPDPAQVGISVPDEGTLVVTLTSPAEYLPKILCHHAFSVVHPTDLKQNKSGEKTNAFRPVSSGAFKIESISDTEIIFGRNRYYWDSANVALPSIRILLETDADVLTDRFNRGEVHWLAVLVNANRILDSNTLQVAPMFSTEYFFFRTTWGPWQDSRVRNALIKAVSLKELRAGSFIEAKTLVFPIAGYTELEGITKTDIVQAKKLLEEAGITDFENIPPLVIRIPEGDYFAVKAKVIQDAWTALGFTVNIDTLPYEVYYTSLRQDNYTIAVTSWIGDFADPLSFLEIFRPESSLNDSGWKNSAFEKLIIESSGKKLVRDRYATLSEAEKLLLNDGVVLPVAHNPSFNVIDTNGLSGWYTNPLDIHPFRFLRFVPKRAMPGVALLTTESL